MSATWGTHVFFRCDDLLSETGCSTNVIVPPKRENHGALTQEDAFCRGTIFVRGQGSQIKGNFNYLIPPATGGGGGIVKEQKHRH